MVEDALIEKEKRNLIYKKLDELNRISFEDKINSLINYYKINHIVRSPQSEIDISKVIETRNRIIHRGSYEDIENNSQEVQLIYEKLLHLVIRIILSIVDYRGSYSFYHTMEQISMNTKNGR